MTAFWTTAENAAALRARMMADVFLALADEQPDPGDTIPDDENDEAEE